MEGELGLVRVRVLSPLVRLSEEELKLPASTTVAHLKTIILARLEGRPLVKVGSFTDRVVHVQQSDWYSGCEVVLRWQTAQGPGLPG